MEYKKVPMEDPYDFFTPAKGSKNTVRIQFRGEEQLHEFLDMHTKKSSLKSVCWNWFMLVTKCLLLVALVAIASTLLYKMYDNYFEKPCMQDKSESTSHLMHINVSSVIGTQCEMDESNRFDCWPEMKDASQATCEKRGCCWKPATKQYTAPYCFFPSDYDGYKAINVKDTAYGKEAKLSRTTATFFSKDVMELNLRVEYQTDSRLRIKLYDPNNKRYEVPLSVPSVETKASNPQYTVAIQSHPFGITVKRKSTGAILFDTTSTAPLIFSDQYLQIATKLSTKYLYGFGEHRGTLLHDVSSWKKLVFWNRDDVPRVNNNGYGTHPFFLNIENGRDASAQGKQNNTHGVFILNSNAAEISMQPYGENQGAITYRSLGGVLDIFVVTGPNVNTLVSQYTNVIGRPYFPPFWSLGFHLCKWGYNSSSTLKKVIQRNRDANMPYDVQWNDIDYMTDHRDWTYDKTRYATLPDVVKDLHDNHQRYIIMADPAISSSQPSGSYAPFDDGKKMDVFVKNYNGDILIGKVWPGDTAFPDFFHPKAVDYWYAQASAFHSQVPFDGLWIDMNEPSSFVDGSKTGCTTTLLDNPPFVPPTIDSGSLIAKTICLSAKQTPSYHYDVHNMYGYSQAKVSRASLDKLYNGKRSPIITRSSFPGSGIYTGHWTGDNDANYQDLYYSIPAILNFNFFGIMQIGADICGFRGSTTPELCTRWTQLGAFYPFMRNHADIASSMQDPGSFSAPYKDYMRSALQLRYKILAVLYTAFYNSHVSGTPILRPLFFLYPGTEGIDKQLMWSDQLLISPVLEQGATNVKAFIPDDTWYDFYTGAALTNTNQEVILDAPIDHINVHIRGGSVLFLLPATVRTDDARQQKFEIIVAPDSSNNANGSLFWDDGESSTSISDEKYSLIEIQQSGSTLTSKVSKSGYQPSQGIKMGQLTLLKVTSQPSSLTINGQSTQFNYDQQNKKLTATGLSVDLLQSLTINWS